MLKVGYIGLGLMGKSIARNILKAGFPLVVHNRSQAAVDELVQEGAQRADSPAQVAGQEGCPGVSLARLPRSLAVMSGQLKLSGAVGNGTTLHSVVRP